MGRGQTDLVAVARITGRGLLRNDALRQFAREGLGNRQVDIPGTRHAHRLIDVAAARQRVADGFDLRGVVMGFILELQEPLLGLSVDVDVDIDRAGVVLFRDLHVVQHPLLLEVAGADRRHVHQAETLVFASQFAADAQVQGQRVLDLLLGERLLDGDALQFGREGRVAAVVAPIGIEDAQFGFIGVASLGAEVFHHLTQVVVVHRQPHPLATGLQFRIRHLPEALQHLDRLHLGLLHVAQHREVLLARLHGVDIVVTNLFQLGIGHPIVEQQQLRRADVDLSFGVDQPHAVDGRRGTLVELSGQELHGDVFAAREITLIGHGVGHHLAEDRIAALLQQFPAEAEQVVDAEQAHFAQFEVQVGIQLPAQALGLDPEAG